MHPTSEKLNTNSKNNNNIAIRGNRNKIVRDFNNPLSTKYRSSRQRITKETAD